MVDRGYSLRPDLDLTILIPARAGSKRIPGKNTKLLGGKPLISWTIDAAKAANVAKVIVSTDDPMAQHIVNTDADPRISLHDRKPEHATDSSPDIEWVLDVLPMVSTPYVAICRPTSPFRTAGTIRRGYAAFMHSGADSIRAVAPVTEHPAKMWEVHGVLMWPVMAGAEPGGTPYHSMPTQSLPPVYKQTASLEIAKVDVIKATKTISGYRIAPFFTDPLESFDLNTADQWEEAERLALKMAQPIL